MKADTANMQIRGNREAGTITGEIVFTLNGERLPETIQVAVMNIKTADLDKSVYYAFVALCKSGLKAHMADPQKSFPGIVISEPFTGKPSEQN